MNLLLTGAFAYTHEQIERLIQLGYCVHFMQQEAEELPLPASKVVAVVCNGLFLHHDIESFSRLRCIQLTSAGFDRVPLDRIEAQGIELHNARGVYSTPMAEWALFRLLEHYKCATHFHKAQHAGSWSKNRNLREIAGTKIAVIGAGNVGQEVAKRFRACGAEVTGFDIHTRPTPNFDSIRPVEMLGTDIGEFDTVVITAPSTPRTHHLLSEQILCGMKHGATLINIARGALIDESALGRILAERLDLYAALDVFENEPLPADSPLWQLPNVAISPHNSFVSNGNATRMFSLMYDNLKKFIEEPNEKVPAHLT